MTEALVRPAPAEAALPETPYVGLVPYSEDDAAFFFGRDDEKRIVTANLRAARLTLVYGPSGVGKSSLLNAGVVHNLRAQVLRSASTGSARAPFAVAVFRGWRDDPLTGLMEQIRASVHEASGGDEPEAWQPGESVVETLRAWTDRARRLLVVLDQFEDYFLYHAGETGDETFDEQFPEIVNEPGLRVHFLVSIREDAWAKLDRFEGRIPDLFANYVRVEHLDRDGGRDAIVGPVAEYNRRLPESADEYTVEPALVEAVLDAAATRPDESSNGAGPAGDEIETPFLQLVMERLWRATVDDGGCALTLATLERLGGAQRIVERHLVEALGSLSPAEQEIAAEAFRYLVTRSRRRVVQSLSDLAEWLGRPEAEVGAVLEKLASGESGRILRPVPPPPGSESEGARYELFHDVLADPILEWRRQFEAERQREAEVRRQHAVRRRFAAIVAGLLLLVVAFAAFAAWALHERSNAKKQAAAAESRALAARALDVQTLDPRGALALAARAERTSPTREAAEALRRTILGWPRPIVLVPRGTTTYGVAFSPDRKLVATASKSGALVSSAATGAPVRTLVPRGLVTSVAFSPDGRELVAAESDGAVRLWRVDDWHPLPSRAHVLGHHLARAAFTADGYYLVAGGHAGWPNRVWRFRDGRIGREVTKRDGLGGWIEPDGSARVAPVAVVASIVRLAGARNTSAATSPSGRTLAVPDFPSTHLYRTRSGKRTSTLSEATGAVFGPGGAKVAVEGEFSGTVIWDRGLEAPAATLSDTVTGGTFSRDGTLFAAASSYDPTTRVWNTTTGELLAELPPRPLRTNNQVQVPNPYPTGKPTAQGELGPPSFAVPTRGPGPAFELQPGARFSPDGGLVATWGRGGRGAQLWEPFAARVLARLDTTSIYRNELLLPAVLSSNGRFIAAARADGTIDLWNTSDGGHVSTLGKRGRYVSALAFDPKGGFLAASGFDRAVRLWRLSDHAMVQTLRGNAKRVGDVTFSPDGKLVASAGEDGTVRVWRTEDGGLVHVLRQPAPVATVAFTADGDALVAGGGDGTTRVWSTGDWRQRAELRPARSRALIVDAVFSRDDKHVATLDRKATARLWDVDSPTPIRTLHNIASVAFSPDGSQLVTGGGDGTARLYQTDTGAPGGIFRGHSDIVQDARFSDDGSLLVTAGADGTARVWQAATDGNLAVVAPSTQAVERAMLAAGGRLVTVSDDGVRLYACVTCLPPSRLLALAKQRLG